jgi:hypothetical protein
MIGADSIEEGAMGLAKELDGAWPFAEAQQDAGQLELGYRRRGVVASPVDPRVDRQDPLKMLTRPGKIALSHEHARQLMKRGCDLGMVLCTEGLRLDPRLKQKA